MVKYILKYDKGAFKSIIKWPTAPFWPSPSYILIQEPINKDTKLIILKLKEKNREKCKN